jgi:hypothetical protein
VARFNPLILLMFFVLFFTDITWAGPPKSHRKQASSDALISHLFKQWTDSLKPVVDNPGKYELQIIFTRINRDANGLPHFEPHRYRVKKGYYFYPASLVKLPVSILALSKLEGYHFPGLDRTTTVFTDSAAPCQQRVHADSTAETGLPSIGNYIKRMMLVSDNFSYSRVYEFLGRDYLRTELNRVGLTGTRIVHRFDGNCSFAENGVLNPMTFLGPRGDTLLHIPLRFTGLLSRHPLGRIRKGRGQQLPNGRIVKRPKDFTQANYLSLEDADGILKRLVMPEAFANQQRFRLSTEDREFLLSQMGKWPRESIFPHYPDSVFEDSHKKYLIYGDVHGKINSDSIRIFNVVGLSYGYISDCAYVIDAARGVEFFISVSLYVNSDGIINDGKYEYQRIGFPFLSRLGRILYRVERDRPKTNKPDLNGWVKLIKADSL